MVSKEKRLFFLYTLLIAVLIIIGFSLLYIYKSQENYFLVVRFYNVLEYSILAYFFSFYIKSKFVLKLLWFSIIGFGIFCISSFLVSKEPEMPFLPASIEHILLLLFILYFFFEILQNVTTEPVYQKAIFWISVAFIINSAGNFFLFLYSKNSFNDDAFKTQYTIIYGIVTFLKNIFLCISIPIKDTPEKTILNESLNIDLDPFKPIEQKP